MDLTTKKYLQGEFNELKEQFAKKHNVIDLQDIADHLSCQFLEAGVDDVDLLLEMMSSESIYRHHDELIEHGAHIDYKRMLHNLSPQLVGAQADKLLLWGCDADDLIDCMSTNGIEENILSLMHNGASADKLINRLDDDGERSFLFWNRELFEQYYEPFQLTFLRSKFQVSATV